MELEDIEKFLCRPYKLGSTDCYGIVRDFYSRFFGIELCNYARYDGFWNDRSLYRDYFESEGFKVVDENEEIQIGDISLVAFRSRIPCHALIHIGGDKILHHPTGRLSCVESYRRTWQNVTCLRIRHKDVKGILDE